MSEKPLSEIVEENIVPLRRYARALLGDATAGDTQVEQVLLGLLNNAFIAHTKIDIFRALDQHMRSLNLPNMSIDARRALLLTAMEEFTLDETSQIMELSLDHVRDLLRQAERTLTAELSARLMIIEDEPLIAAHLGEIAQSIGHQVVGMAATKTEAIKKNRELSPEIILTDIRLADNSLGTEAIAEMSLNEDVPVIFITAYPEDVLSDQGLGPIYLITKPFNVDYVKAVISQALLNTRSSAAV